ncbi:hypothetical protein H5T87_01285 [bacterium]|nr:hypothetical protein [bacterium]
MRYTVYCFLVLICILLLGSAIPTQCMALLSDEVMASIRGASGPPYCGTEALCAAYPTCIPGIGGCVKLPTSLPGLQSNPNDNMANEKGYQCGVIWAKDCKDVSTQGCGGYIVNSVDP